MPSNGISASSASCSRTLLVEAEYVGSAGKHLTLCYNPNEVQPGPGSHQSRRLLQPVSNLSNMLQCDPRNRSTFHAGTLKVQQRFSKGLQFLVSYTYGKALDYGGAAASGGGAVERLAVGVADEELQAF